MVMPPMVRFTIQYKDISRGDLLLNLCLWMQNELVEKTKQCLNALILIIDHVHEVTRLKVTTIIDKEG